VVTGTAVLLIGGGLISSGVKYLGGGVFCGENAESKVAAGFGVPQLCNENGQVVLTFGAPEYIGLGCSVIFASTLVQFFGSPFLKSTFLFWGLAFGCFVAAVTYHTAVPGDKTTCFTEPDKPCIGGFADATPGKKYYYYSGENIQAVEPFTFLWVTTFPLGFAVEYFLPILIGFFISTAETVGDIGLSYIASELPTGERSDVDSRIQGGLLGDGLNSLFACLMTTPPNTTFSQNNGVIALTRCASRSAGFSCAAWLVLYGVFGQIGGLFTSIPICVVGGMVLQLFTMVFVSGMKMACTGACVPHMREALITNPPSTTRPPPCSSMLTPPTSSLLPRRKPLAPDCIPSLMLQT
jgi:NCS2 family nucleobase:cation symporter-2